MGRLRMSGLKRGLRVSFGPASQTDPDPECPGNRVGRGSERNADGNAAPIIRDSSIDDAKQKGTWSNQQTTIEML